MDNADLGPAMGQAFAESRIDKLERRVKALEDLILAINPWEEGSTLMRPSEVPPNAPYDRFMASLRK